MRESVVGYKKKFALILFMFIYYFQTDRCLEAGCLDNLTALLRCGKPSLVKEAAWAVSNVLAGTQVQIQQVVDKGLLEHLVFVLTTEDIK